MEINYDLIIKYLVTKKNTFASKKHILVNSDLFPENFKDFLQNKFYRYGINQTDSLYTTLLTLLNKNFLTCTNDEEIYEINKFKKSIDEFLETYDKPEYLQNDIEIQLLSEILDINFIIFDFKYEDIKIVYTGLECNPYKPTLLIANCEEFYEPIIYEVDNKKIFSYNDPIIKKIYQSDIKIYPGINKTFKLNDNLSVIIPGNNDSTFIKSTSTQENEYSMNKLLKMTKKELEIILNNKNIKVSNFNKMLKKDIVDIILK
jgi:hypothetical protein